MPAGASGSDAVKVLWIGGLTCEGPLGEVAAFDAPPPKQHPLQGVPGVQLRWEPLPDVSPQNPHTRMRRVVLWTSAVSFVVLATWFALHWEQFKAHSQIWLPACSVLLWLMLKLVKSLDSNALRWLVSEAVSHQAAVIADFKPDVLAGWSFGASVACFCTAAGFFKGGLLLVAPSVAAVTRKTHGGDFLMPPSLSLSGCKALVVHGTDDLIIKVKESIALVSRHKDRLPMQLEQIPGAGHLLVDDPKEVKAWLRKLRGMPVAPPEPKQPQKQQPKPEQTHKEAAANTDPAASAPTAAAQSGVRRRKARPRRDL